MKTNVTYGECYVFSKNPMHCPLCKILVPPNTEHSCKKGVSADSVGDTVREAFRPIVQSRKETGCQFFWRSDETVTGEGR